MAANFIDSYAHGNKIGVLIELETVDDFATRTDEFQALARDLAMHIAACNPVSVDGPGPALMTQPFVKDDSIVVADRVKEVEAKLDAFVRVVRFSRIEAGAT